MDYFSASLSQAGRNAGEERFTIVIVISEEVNSDDLYSSCYINAFFFSKKTVSFWVVQTYDTPKCFVTTMTCSLYTNDQTRRTMTGQPKREKTKRIHLIRHFKKMHSTVSEIIKMCLLELQFEIFFLSFFPSSNSLTSAGRGI